MRFLYRKLCTFCCTGQRDGGRKKVYIRNNNNKWESCVHFRTGILFVRHRYCCCCCCCRRRRRRSLRYDRWLKTVGVLGWCALHRSTQSHSRETEMNEASRSRQRHRRRRHVKLKENNSKSIVCSAPKCIWSSRYTQTLTRADVRMPFSQRKCLQQDRKMYTL